MCLFIGGLFLLLALSKVPARDTTPNGADGPRDIHWADPTVIHTSAWSVVRGSLTETKGQTGPLTGRFRLAGTFFAYPGEQDTDASAGARRAIIDDLEKDQQILVQEGDRMERVEVVRIYRDRAILRDERGEEEIRLSFLSPAATGGDQEAANAVESNAPLRFEDMPALETSRFGRRIADNRWVLNRDEIMRYADELQADPQRLSAFFLSMQPDYNAEEEIAGFEVDLLGEDALYQAAGLQNGDVVRMVNSMPMTSPARAQYFIREFINGRISALVFDIERGGEEQKLIHLIR